MMFWALLLLLAGGWSLHLVWRALERGEVQQSRGWRIYCRSSEPLAYGLTVLLYAICAALGLGLGGMSVFHLLMPPG